MSTVTFDIDTHSLIKRLMGKNFTEAQAEEIITITREIRASDVSEFIRKHELKESDNRYSREILEIKRDIKILEAKLTIRIYIALGAMTTFLCIALPILIKRL